MKILSNFDTNFRRHIYSQKLQEFSEDKILVILRSKYYLIFKVLFPFSILIGILFLMIVSLDYIQAYPFILWMLCFVWFLVFWFRVFRKFIKYKYDFTIVTPRGILTYQQKGILHNRMKEIPSKRIKAIQISRTGLLWNIFGFGEIDIIADMTDTAHMWEDEDAPWVMAMTYVDFPFEVKNKISKLCFE